jgi:hypothetical protein
MIQRLRVVAPDGKNLDNGNLWRTTNFYDTKKRVESTISAAPRVYIPGRIVVKDLDGDGLSEVMVNKNSVSTLRLSDRVRWFDRGEIHNLVWDENALTTNWKTREIEGYISDFQVKDADNDGEPELVVGVIDLAESPLAAQQNLFLQVVLNNVSVPSRRSLSQRNCSSSTCPPACAKPAFADGSRARLRAEALQRAGTQACCLSDRKNKI